MTVSKFKIILNYTYVCELRLIYIYMTFHYYENYGICMITLQELKGLEDNYCLKFLPLKHFQLIMIKCYLQKYLQGHNHRTLPNPSSFPHSLLFFYSVVFSSYTTTLENTNLPVCRHCNRPWEHEDENQTKTNQINTGQAKAGLLL